MNFEIETMPSPTGAELIPVVFEFKSTSAQSVCIAGTFNHWNPHGLPMTTGSKGLWTRSLHLPPGSYEYCLVVDGDWRLDPANQCSVPNEFGGQNSILTVPHSSDWNHRSNAMRTPLESPSSPPHDTSRKSARKNFSGLALWIAKSMRGSGEGLAPAFPWLRFLLFFKNKQAA